LNGEVRTSIAGRVLTRMLTQTIALQYIVPWARIGTPKSSARDPKVGAKLWDWMTEQVKKHEETTSQPSTE